MIDLMSWVNGPKIVYVEKPHAGAYFASARILFGLLAVVEGRCADVGVPCVLVSPKAVKKFWTGNGDAKKEDMLARGNKLPQYKKVKSDNVMDSIALWHYAQEQELRAKVH
jgi:Holliday junction resolvasome RuvABC endonuclease subunit